MSDHDLLPILRTVRHFDQLPREIQLEIARAAIRQSFEAGQVIYLEGEPAEKIYILETGWVKATRMTLEGRQQAMLFLQPGEVFGDIAVFSDVPYPGTVIALEPARVWVIDKPTILALIQRHPELAMAVIRRLSERVLYYIGLVEDLSLRTVEARLSNTLLKHVRRDGPLPYIPRRSWTTLDEMAVRLGTVRDVLSRVLHNLEADGLLRVDRDAIIILDEQRLRNRGKS